MPKKNEIKSAGKARILFAASMEAVRKIAVIGAGGVGGYFGGRLAQLRDECQVHFVVRGETLQVLKRDGLRVDSLVGDFHIPPDRCNATGSAPSFFYFLMR
jgi:ketopantoate reductase